MQKIAHRGNTSGPSIYENQIWYIEEAIKSGYDVEVDIWRINSNLWLGHNSAEYSVSEDFLNAYADKLWIHCKNLDALQHLLKNKGLNVFWHQEDDYTITSKGYIWTYPGKLVTDNSVIVTFGKELGSDYSTAFGVCGDYVGLW